MSAKEKPLPGLSQKLPFCPLRRGAGIRPTFHGFVYLGLLCALLLGSINHNNNLGYLLTFLLSGILLASLRQTWLNVQHLQPLSCLAEPVFAGTSARFALTLAAPDQEHAGLDLSLSPDAPARLDLLPAGQSRRVELNLPAPRRGLLHCGQLTITSSFPFGLFECRKRQTLAASSLVYPKPLTTPFVSSKRGEEEEKGPTAPLVAGHDFSGISPYRPGDSLARIHWKSLARGLGLHVTEFEEENSSGAFFALDQMPGSDLEYRLSCLCYLVLAASSRGLRYGLDLGQLKLGPDSGPRHQRRCLEALALYGSGGGSHD